MAVNSTLKSGDRVPAASPALIPCGLGTCQSGTVGTSYAFDPGQDVRGVLGAGKLTQWVLYMHATSGSRVVAVPTTGTYPALPSVTATGSPPTVTVAKTSGNTRGAYDDLSLLLTIKVAGANGVAQADLAYDGVDEVERITIPAENPAALLGTVAITADILAKVTALTLVFTAPAAKTLTFPVGSLASSAAGLKAATATVAAPVTVLAAALLTAGKAALLANPRKLRFTTAGTGADAPASVDIVGTDYLGASQIETLSLAQTATSVSSAKVYASIVSLDYPTADGTGATIAVGYEDAYATAAELIAEVNTLALAAPLAMVATGAEAASGTFLRLASTGLGTGVTLTIDDATSTGEALFGFTTAASNLTATGTAATLALPWSGVTLTFASGSYPLAATYSIPLQGPRTSVAALSAGAVSAHDAYQTNPFGFICPVEEFSSCANAATALDTLNTLRAGWHADTAAPIFVDVLLPTAFHTASATRATNDTNIGINDAAFVAAFPAATPDSVFCNVAHDDIYIPGAAGLPAGTFRRPAAWAGASKVAGANKIAANPADGGIFGATVQGPSGALARNENTATTKLGGLGGAGAWVVKSTSAGLASPAFEVAATRAGSTSRLRDPGALRIGLEISRIIFGEVESWNGQTWEGQAANPVAADVSETQPREDHLEQLLRATLIPDVGPRNVTAFDVVVTAPTLGNDSKASVRAPYNPLNVVGIVNVDVTATGAAITPAG